MKTERNKLIDLLKQCDNERMLFRKLNLEMMKLVVDYKNGDVCVSNPMRNFIDRSYSLNYELLNKTCRRFEGKLLETE